MSTLLPGLLFWCVIGVLASLLVGRYMRMPGPRDAHDAVTADAESDVGTQARRRWPARFNN